MKKCILVLLSLFLVACGGYKARPSIINGMVTDRPISSGKARVIFYTGDWLFTNTLGSSTIENKAYPADVTVDDHKAFKVGPGEIVSADLDPGQHTIKSIFAPEVWDDTAKMLSAPYELNIKAGETKYLHIIFERNQNAVSTFLGGGLLSLAGTTNIWAIKEGKKQETFGKVLVDHKSF